MLLCSVRAFHECLQQKQPCVVSGLFIWLFTIVVEEFLSLSVENPNCTGTLAASGAASGSWQAVFCKLAWGSVGSGGQGCIAAQLLSATVKLILQLGSTQNQLTQAGCCCGKLAVRLNEMGKSCLFQQGLRRNTGRFNITMEEPKQGSTCGLFQYLALIFRSWNLIASRGCG